MEQGTDQYCGAGVPGRALYRRNDGLRPGTDVSTLGTAAWWRIAARTAAGKSSDKYSKLGISDPHAKLLLTNLGAARARNLGVNEAKGRYLAYINVINLWTPDKLEKKLGFSEEKQAAFVFTGYEFADENGKGTGRILGVPGHDYL